MLFEDDIAKDGEGMTDIQNGYMNYDVNDVERINNSCSETDSDLVNMDCNQSFQEFQTEFEKFDKNYKELITNASQYDNNYNRNDSVVNIKNKKLVNNSYNGDSAKILNDSFAKINVYETNIKNDLVEMIKINEENNAEIENTDNSIWSKLDDFVTKLVSAFIPSAKAESDEYPILYGDLVRFSKNFFERKYGLEITNNTYSRVINGKTYNLYFNDKNLTLAYPDGKLTFSAYNTEQLSYLPEYNDVPESQAKYVENVYDRVSIMVILPDHGNTTIENSDFKFQNYTSNDNEYIIISVEGEYNQDDILALTTFLTNTVRTSDEGFDGKINFFTFSNALGTLHGAVSRDDNDYINGDIHGYDYAPFKVGNQFGRGQVDDRYTDSSNDKFNKHILRNNQMFYIYDSTDNRNDEPIKWYANNNGLSEKNFDVIQYNGGHTLQSFQQFVKNQLNLKER